MTESITSLADLAAQANENHQLAESTAGRALEFARLSGIALTEAKSQVGHGGWIAWLNINFRATERTAQKYMKLASNTNCDSYLEAKSINEALRMIAGDDEEELEEETPEPDEEEPTLTQHGAIQDAEITSEEPRAVAVEIVEEDEEDAESEAPEVEIESDSEKLSLLKSTWTKASKKDKLAFAAWLNKNWKL